MAMFNAILLLCGLAISAEAMGFIRYPKSHDDDCDCEQKNSTTSATPTTPTTTIAPTHTVFNCTKGLLYNRVPTDANSYTGYWCLSIKTNNRQEYTENGDAKCKANVGPEYTITLPENAEELASIYQRFQTYFENNDGYPADRWTLVVDGHLKPSCSPLNSCSASTSFEFSDSRTDPTFIMTQWKAGQPDPQYFNGTQKECLGIDQDSKLRNIFCSGGDSPINGTDGRAEYYPHGILCGAPAKAYVLPGDA